MFTMWLLDCQVGKGEVVRRGGGWWVVEEKVGTEGGRRLWLCRKATAQEVLDDFRRRRAGGDPWLVLAAEGKGVAEGSAELLGLVPSPFVGLHLAGGMKARTWRKSLGDGLFPSWWLAVDRAMKEDARALSVLVWWEREGKVVYGTTIGLPRMTPKDVAEGQVGKKKSFPRRGKVVVKDEDLPGGDGLTDLERQAQEVFG